jgi:transglutaminase-like putative cysteine protease
MLKKFLLIAFFWLFSFLFTSNLSLNTVFAQDNRTPGSEFASSYDVVYDVSEDGITTVTEKVSLRNLTSQFYANQFKLTIGATQIFDIKGSDPGGPLDISSEQQGTATSISVKFNQQVAGLGKILPWSLQFKSKDFAEKTGKVWEIRAPKISSSTNLESYNLTITVPTSFGEPTLISPTPQSQTVSAGKLFLTFNKDQLKDSGVSASFGNFQLFDFDLTYHLQNDKLVTILTNVALPPDTAYQDVIFQFIDPKPVNVTQDADGNYLAWYNLSRGQKLDIRVLGSAKLYTYSKIKNFQLSEDLRKKYTQSDKYWEKDNPQIRNLLSEILGSNTNETEDEKIRKIYRYVVGALKYNPDRLKDNIERLGAVTALANPESAVCMEFTDLFIALSRSAGIPARELNGFAYTANAILRPLSLTQDVLHAWPQYWSSEKGWVMVDPTWENTTGGVDYFSKLDLNHFVFAIKGTSSTNPIPAGSYKYKNENSQDVIVKLSDNDFLGKPQLNVKIQSSGPILAGFPAEFKLSISNVGNAVYPATSFSVSTDKLNILDKKSNINLGSIPAYGTAEFAFNIRTASLFDNFEDTFRVVLNGQEYIQKIEVKPFLLFRTIPLIFLSTVLVIISIYALVLGGLLYRKRYLRKSAIGEISQKRARKTKSFKV